MNLIIFALLAVLVGVAWLLYSILNELQIIRTLLELPTWASKAYDDRLGVIGKQFTENVSSHDKTSEERLKTNTGLTQIY